MYIFVALFAAYCFYLSPGLRILLFNLPYVLFYFPKDLFFYFKHKRWRELNTGKIVCYCAPDFGGGKTLSAVQYIEDTYNTYNDRVVWDFSRKKFVVQKVRVVSNVVFNNIPYENFTTLTQICNASKEQRIVDEANDTLTCCIFFMDEASSELNSRSFKDNLNPFVLKDIVTCRHNHISIVMTSQDFSMIDALMRRVTSKVIYAFKTWRLCVHYFYDPKELENAGSYRLIRSCGKGGFFVRDRNYNAYDTFATVDKLNKRIEEGDIISEQEILDKLALGTSDTEKVMKHSKRFLRSRKRLTKGTT